MKASAPAFRSPGHDFVNQPIGQRIRRADRLAGGDHFQRLGHAHQPRQALGAARAGDQAQIDFRLAELGRRH